MGAKPPFQGVEGLPEAGWRGNRMGKRFDVRGTAMTSGVGQPSGQNRNLPSKSIV
jgi:hypothetical protein